METTRIRLLFLGAILSFSSIFQMGYANAYPNTAIDSFRVFLTDAMEKNGYHLSTSGFAWLWSGILNTWFVGFAIGSWLAVPIADRIGRRTGLLLGNILNFLSACMSSLGVCLHWTSAFALGRLIFAMSAAMSMNCLILLLQECAPTSMRGVMSFYAEMAFVVTNLVGAMVGMRSVLGWDLPWLVGISCIVTLASVLLVFPFHESPKFLLMKRKNREGAEKALYFYQRTDEVATGKILEEYSKENSEHGSLSEILRTPHSRKGLLLGICCLQVAISVWPVVYYSTEFLKFAGIPYDTAELVSTAMLFISSLFTIVGMFVVEKFDRRTLFLWSGGVNMGALTMFVVCAELQKIFPGANVGCIIAVVAHGASYSIALGPIAWFITAELLPIEFRATAQSIALSVNQLTALVLVFITLPLYHVLGPLTLVPLFVLPGCVALIIIYFHLPETRDREIAEVIHDLKGAQAVSPIPMTPKEVGDGPCFV